MCGWVWRAVAAGLLLQSCGHTLRLQSTTPSNLPDPSESVPIVACAVTCPNSLVSYDEVGTSDEGFSFHQQFKCKGSTRHLRDVQLIGTVLDHWLVCAEYDVKAHRCGLAREFQKRHVVLKRCREVQRDAMDARRNSENGRMPGEDEFGNSLSPPP